MSPLTVPPTVNCSVTHVTLTFVTLSSVMVSLPLSTLQVCDGVVGWVNTVTT